MLVSDIEQLSKFKADGIIGLGRKNDSEFNYTFMDALY